jgi:alkylation response protein AidB-like acyl-CoA dehydrogenase
MPTDETPQLWSASPARRCSSTARKAGHPIRSKDGRAQHFSNAEVVRFEGAGHWVHHDQFDRNSWHGRRRSSLSASGCAGRCCCASATEEQRSALPAAHLQRRDFWCQGYSEPGSGSDLASLKTKARRQGDHYVVNGQKIWTTLGHYADWIFCLVRTDATASKRQEGISFLLMDMKSPGVQRQTEQAKAGQAVGHTASILKYAAAKMNQDRHELLIESLGTEGLGWEGEGFDKSAIKVTRQWLRSKGNSIEGGTSEINLNVIAKRVLGLPD